MQSNFNSFLAIIFDNFIKEWEANYNIKLKCTKICTNMHIVYITNISGKWCCRYPSLGGRFKSASKNNVFQCLMYLYSHTNRVYSDSLRVTAATVDNSRSLYVLYGLLSTRITAFDLSQFPCVWISNELFIIRGFTSINDFTNKNDFVQLKKKIFYSFLWRRCVCSPRFYYFLFLLGEK